MALFPTTVLADVTEHPQPVVDAAVQLCRATGAPLHLARVTLTSPLLRGRTPGAAQREALRRESQALLDRICGQVEEQGVTVAGAHTRAGSSAAAVLSGLQEELDAGLLVVGAATARAAARRVLAAPATAAVRSSPRSVLVVRG